MRPRADLWRRGKLGVELNARVIPGSSRNSIEDVYETAQGPLLRIRVRAIADKGDANRSVEQVVAHWLGVPRTAVSILAGMTSRTKRIGIAGPLDRVETPSRPG
jgi:uncharacterized protein